MAYHGSVTRASLENAVRPNDLRITSIIQLALVASPLFFLLVIFLLITRSDGVEGAGGENTFLWLLTIVHLAMTVAAFLMGHFLAAFRAAQLRTGFDASGFDAEALAQACVAQHRFMTILRLALMEGAAYFGLVVCLLAVNAGALPADGKYWINLVSTLLLVGYGLFTLPTKERIGDWFEKLYLQ